ncbi:MAG: rhodanese-like domain-containing protein [Myxococcales bacterium]|nr:rhodanese-like domain-containing protein [Myxococcales bacterium]
MKLGDWIPFGAVPSIEARVLHARLEGGEALQLVDVRTLVEHRTSRIAGAVSAPIASLAVQLEALDLDLARPVVCICLSAHRSIPAVRLIRERGHPDVAQLAGGMAAWWAAGLPTERG